MKLSLGEVKRELEDLGRRIDANFEGMNRKFERADIKIDRLVYFFLGGLVL